MKQDYTRSDRTKWTEAKPKFYYAVRAIQQIYTDGWMNVTAEIEGNCNVSEKHQDQSILEPLRCGYEDKK